MKFIAVYSLDFFFLVEIYDQLELLILDAIWYLN